jgi:transposase
MTMIGIDSHAATHTAVAVDDDENVIDEFALEVSHDQVERLTSWADGLGKREWAVESANGLGYLIARQLVGAGETVFDVPPVLASRVRLLGSRKSQKNDPNDARSIAIAALRSDRLAVVEPDDHVTVLRLLVKRHRDMARLRNKHCSRLHALLFELTAGGIGVKILTQRGFVRGGFSSEFCLPVDVCVGEPAWAWAAFCVGPLGDGCTHDRLLGPIDGCLAGGDGSGRHIEYGEVLA